MLPGKCPERGRYGCAESAPDSGERIDFDDMESGQFRTVWVSGALAQAGVGFDPREVSCIRTSHTIRGLTNGTGYLVAVDTNFGSDGGILSPGG